MPVYEYRCVKGHTFERILPVTEYLTPQVCTCGHPAEKHILHAPRVFSDLEGYESPASGKWIEGKRAREADFRETGTRPYELGEREHAARERASEERQLDAVVDRVVEQTLNELTI